MREARIEKTPEGRVPVGGGYGYYRAEAAQEGFSC